MSENRPTNSSRIFWGLVLILVGEAKATLYVKGTSIFGGVTIKD